MTRIILLVLALLEMAAGVFGLVAVAGLFSLHDVGMLTSFWPVLAIVVLLLGAAAAIFVRRPWSYWLHIATVLLAGALYAFFVGPLFGVGTLPPWLQAALVVAPLTVIFFLPPVRRFFGV
ncbi:MAG: hypothetical protein R6W76_09700 [Caldilinea sp.]